MTDQLDELSRQAVAIGERVFRQLRNEFPNLSEYTVEDCVAEAVSESLCTGIGAVSFLGLHRAAWRNAANAARSERARQLRERNWWIRLSDGHALASQSAALDDSRGLVLAVMSLLPDAETKAMFQLWLDGEFRTPRFAKSLGVTALPLREQRIRVKRAKDRMLKHLQRSAAIRALVAEATGRHPRD